MNKTRTKDRGFKNANEFVRQRKTNKFTFESIIKTEFIQ